MNEIDLIIKIIILKNCLIVINKIGSIKFTIKYKIFKNLFHLFLNNKLNYNLVKWKRIIIVITA